MRRRRLRPGIVAAGRDRRHGGADAPRAARPRRRVRRGRAGGPGEQPRPSARAGRAWPGTRTSGRTPASPTTCRSSPWTLHRLGGRRRSLVVGLVVYLLGLWPCGCWAVASSEGPTPGRTPTRRSRVGRERGGGAAGGAGLAAPAGASAMCPCGCIGKRRKGSYLAKTLSGGAALLQQVMFGEDVAGRGGLLQRIDPRVKLVSLLGAAGGRRPRRTRWSRWSSMYALTLVLAAARRCPWGSSSSGCGCSCRSSPGSWCCRRRCRSSPPATSCCPCGTGTAHRASPRRA